MPRVTRRSLARHEPNGRLQFSESFAHYSPLPGRGVAHMVKTIAIAESLFRRGCINAEDLEAARTFFDSYPERAAARERERRETSGDYSQSGFSE